MRLQCLVVQDAIDHFLVSTSHHGDGRVALWLKLPDGAQQALVDSDPDLYFVPPYVGPSGWIGVRLDVPSLGAFADNVEAWDELQDFLEDSYCLVAPKKLAALLDPPSP